MEVLASGGIRLDGGQAGGAGRLPTVDDVRTMAEQKGVDPNLAVAIFSQESGGNFQTKPSPKGAIGGMQVMPDTFKQMLPAGDINNPWHNLEAGILYLAHGQKKLGTNDPKILAAGYHQGYNRPELARGEIAPTSDGLIQTPAYAGAVVARMGVNPQAQAQPQQRPPTWAEVLQHPTMKDLGADDLEKARAQYFVDVVAPTVRTAKDLRAAKAAFDSETAPKSFMQDLTTAIKKSWETFKTSEQATAFLATGGDAAPLSKSIATDVAAQKEPPTYVRPLMQAVKEANDTQGFWQGLLGVGKVLYAGVTNPKATAYVTTENLANQIASLSGMVVGGVAGSAMGPAGTLGGMALGALAGNHPEAGSKLVELAVTEAQKRQLDPSKPEAIQAVLDDPAFQTEARKQGLLKWAVVGGVDALTALVGAKLLTGPQRALQAQVTKELAARGVNVADKAAVKAALEAPDVAAALRPAIERAAAASTAGQKALRTGGAFALETVGEGTGELLGEAAASGEWKPGEAALESLASIGQSAGQTVATKALTAPGAVASVVRGGTGAGAPPAPPAPADPARGAGAAAAAGGITAADVLEPEPAAIPVVPDTKAEAATPPAMQPASPPAPAVQTPAQMAAQAGIAPTQTESVSPVSPVPVTPKAESVTSKPADVPAKPKEPGPILQNRDRSSDSSIAQMNESAGNPDPARLSISRTMDSGAPIVFANADRLILPDGAIGREDVAVDAAGRRTTVKYAVVEAADVLASHSADGSKNADYGTDRTPGRIRAINNGRTAGLQEAYRRGTADKYRAGIRDDAEQLGIDPAVIDGMKAPVLVRVMGESDVTNDIGDRSNAPQVSALSAVERAANDARRVDLAGMEFGDDGAPSSDALRQFVQAMPSQEQAELAPNGVPTAQAVDRMLAAIFHQAYGPRLTELYAQAADPDAKNVLRALAMAAPDMGALDGAGEYDFRDAVRDAVEAFISARRRNILPADIAAQADLTLSADTRTILDLLAANARRPKVIGERFAELAKLARALADAPATDMFGERRATRDELLGRLRDGEKATSVGDSGRRGPDAARTEGGEGAAPGTQTAERPTDVRGNRGKRPEDAQGPGDVAAPKPEQTPSTEGVSASEERPALDLTGETPADLAAAAAKRAEDAAKAAEASAKEAADAARGDFTLTGSDRQADEAEARGQKDLLSQAPKGDVAAADVASVSEDEFDAMIQTAQDERADPSAQSAGSVPAADFDKMIAEVQEERSKPKRARKPAPPKADAKAPKAPKKGGTDSLKDAGQHAAAGVKAGFAGLDALFGRKSTLGSGPSFDEETWAKAKPHFEVAFKEFVEAGRSLKDFIRHILDVYNDAIVPYLRRWHQDKIREAQNADQDHGIPPEPDRPPVPDELGPKDVGAGPGPTGDGRGPSLQGTDAETGAEGGERLRDGDAAAAGEQGDLAVSRDDGTPGSPIGPAGDHDPARGGDSSLDGVQPDAGGAAEARPSTRRQPSFVERLAAQKSAERLPIKPGDIDNIRASLPVLLEGQQDDVRFAEERFAKPEGQGVLFTNGTGTGKTMSGLGIVKRFAKLGKTNIIIVAPSDKIASDWVSSAEWLGLNVSMLEDTKSAGDGIVVTTYANFGQNEALFGRKWDLVVTDESHYLMNNKEGTSSAALHRLQLLTMHRDSRHAYARARFPKEYAEFQDAIAAASQFKKETPPESVTRRLEKARVAWKAAEEAGLAEFDATPREKKARVVFLSATPFAYHFNVDYAEGYLFDFEGQPRTGYNQPGPRDAFYMQHFGYRMRYGKLTQPERGVDVGLMEINFNGWLKREKSLSSRMLDVEADYDRRFVLVDDAIGRKIDEGMAHLNSAKGGRFAPLYAHMMEGFTYHNRMYLLEALKARHAVPMVREYLKRGFKVVLFHDFLKGGGFHPFHFSKRSDNMEMSVSVLGPDGKRSTVMLKWNDLVEEFNRDRQDLVNLDFNGVGRPLNVMANAFPEALFFNGTVPKQKRREAVAKFNTDGGQHNLIIVQSDAGREGISLHDTTGKHRRVLINLGMPVRPTAAIQIEGRIYRTGQVSDASFRYLNTGTNYEQWTFAQKIAERAGTAENLAMGDDARALKETFIEAFDNSDSAAIPEAEEGKGGKARDRARARAASPFDRAKTFYWATAKKNSRTKSAEGTDYFATPEPLGMKMVEWGGLRDGERGLEPSAGHGAIGRFFPHGDMTLIEASYELAGRAKLNAPDTRILNERFEDHSIVNKYDVIAMNPPFGKSGKLAMEHLAKAARHLNDGGRIVALLPEGDADKRLEKFLYGTETRPVRRLFTFKNPDGKAVDAVKGDTVVGPGGYVHGTIVKAESGGVYVSKKGIPGATWVPLRSFAEVQPTGQRTEEVNLSEGLYLVADIGLPTVTFERAGTGVKTHIIVLERQDTKEGAQRIQQRSRRDIEAKDIREFFDAIEHMTVPERVKAPEAKPTQAPAASSSTAPASAPAAGKPAGTEGPKYVTDAPEVTYTTQKGKTITGVIAKDLTHAQAKEIDPFTWKRDGGFFIRSKHVQRKDAPKLSRKGKDPAFETPRSDMGTNGLPRLATDSIILAKTHLMGNPSETVSTSRAGLYDPQSRQMVGEVIFDFNRETKQIEAIRWITVERQARARGHAEAAVRAILAYNDPSTQVQIVSILDDAKKFWRRLGANFDATEETPDGTITRGEFAQAGRATASAAQGGAKPSAQDSAQGRGGPTGPRRSQARKVATRTPADAGVSASVARVSAELEARMGRPSDALGIKIVGSIAGLPAGLKSYVESQDATDTQGLYDPDTGTAYLVASNIAPGRAFAVYLHELGVHKGLRGLLGDERMAALAKQVRAWSRGSGTIEEIRLAKIAAAKIPEGTPAAVADEELIAYFVETAVNAGHDIPESRPQRGRLAQWLHDLWTAVRSAMEKLGAAPDTLTAAEVVALARGAAERAAKGAAINQTESAAFKRWFQGSKVVDAQGRPIAVYHGTTAAKDFVKFKTPAYFTDSADGAQLFGEEAALQDVEVDDAGNETVIGSRLLPVYLNIRSPKVVRDFGDFAEWDARRRTAAEKQGFDGVKIVMPDNGEVLWMAFRPEQIKSAVGNRGTFSPNDPSIVRSVYEPTFYSALLRAVESLKMNAAPAAQWIGTLNGMTKAGVKADEIQWSGVLDWLGTQTGKVTREQVAEYLRANGVQVTETRLGFPVELQDGPVSLDELTEGELSYIATKNDPSADVEGLSRDDLLQMVQGMELEDEYIRSLVRVKPGQGNLGTKFSNYQLPGGKNYRELLLTLPSDTPTEDRGGAYYKETTTDFRSQHFDQPNIVAHVRFNERTDADGRRVLFIEEVQSDWAQKGRKEGFSSERKLPDGWVFKAEKNGRPPVDGWMLYDDEGERIAWAPTKEEALAKGAPWMQKANGAAVPSAPFVTKTESWVALSLKRMIRYAAERGFDSIAWTTGEQQAARYDLSKQVDSISWEPTKTDGAVKDIEMRLPNKNPIRLRIDGDGSVVAANGPGFQQFEDKQLADIIGKYLAEKIMAENGSGSLSGEGLNIGGDGMKSFYDRIVPNVANDVLRKLGGGNVVPVMKAIAMRGTAPQMGFAITPELRAKAMAGQPLFSRAGTQVQQQAAARRSYGDVARAALDRVDSVMDPLHDLPNKGAYLTARYLALGKIAKVDDLAKGIRETFSNATAEDRRAAYDYLTTADAEPDAIVGGRTRERAKWVKEQINYVGDQLVERGLLSEESREANRDAYLPRLYLKHLLSEQDFRALGSGRKPSDMGYLKARKDLSEETRKAILGEIEDPGFLSAVAIAKPVRDMALLDWLAEVATNKDWVLPQTLVQWRGRRVSAMWLKSEAARIRRQAPVMPDKANAKRAREIADQMDELADDAVEKLKDADLSDWRQIPDTARYGRLRGIWVRSEIYDDMMGVNDFLPTNPGFFQSLLGYGGIGTKATQLWKMSKVALNPPAQVRNFVSNGVLLQLSGVPLARVPQRIIQAFREISNNGKHWQVAKKYGVTASTFSTQELYRFKRELLDLQKQDGTLSPLMRVWRIAAIVGDWASDLYQKSEAVFKTAKIIDAMERQGLSEADAAMEAQKWLFDYSLVPKEVRYLRNAPIGMPFLTFAAKVLPRLIEVATLHPMRLLPWVALSFGLPVAVASMLGVSAGDLDKLKKALPKWLQERGHAYILPFQDSDGRWQAIDLGYFFPWTMYTQFAGDIARGEPKEALGTIGLFSGPVLDVIIALKTNEDPFTNREIVKPGDPPAAQAVSIVNYLYDLMAPPWLSSKGLVSLNVLNAPLSLFSTSVDQYLGKAYQAATGKTNKYGDPTTTGMQAAVYPFGVNLYSLEAEHTRAANLLRMKFEIDQVRQGLNKRMQDRGLSTERRQEIVDEYRTEMERRVKKIQEYAKESEVPPTLRARTGTGG